MFHGSAGHGTAMIEHFIYENQLAALVIRRDFRRDGIEFFTPDDFSQQLAYMQRPKGYQIEPHLHQQVKREVVYTQEVLWIKSGTVRVDFYDTQRVYQESTILQTGDVILLAHGGHGFYMLADSEMIEVKQGPYAGDGDKVRFAAVPPDQVVLR